MLGGENMENKPIFTEVFDASLDQEGVIVGIPHSVSPYRPMFVGVTKDSIYLTVWDEKRGMLEKKFDYKDLLVMHKALTKILGRKPKNNKKV